MELLAVFSVLSQFRVRRSGLLRSSLTFLFLVVEVPTVFLVFTLNREQQLYMFLRNAFLSGLSRSVLVEIFLLVVQVLPRQGSAAAGAEQLADIVSSGGPHGFLPG